MDVRIKSADFEIPAQTSAYLDERLAHIEKLLADTAELARCEVEIGRDAGRPRHGANIWFAEIQIIRPGERIIRATNRSESIHGAIDDAKSELERQIRSEKRVHRRFIRKAGALTKRFLHLNE